MNKKNEKNYNIGLDIGTNSVGWAVTDLNNNLLKKGKKNMWGSRLFDTANTAAQTRGFRGQKRRLERRRERINILKSLVNDDMESEYPNFFPRLKETSLVFDDKTEDKINGKKYNLFNEIGMNDEYYYSKFPTIYHLRKALLDSDEKFDFRLVYLAMHHIIKYRGNFLYEGNLKNSDNNIDDEIQNIIEYVNEKFEIICKENCTVISEILKNKLIHKSDKLDQIMNLFDYLKDEKAIIKAIVSAFLGYKFDVSKIFNIELENSTITFAKEIEDEEQIKNMLGDNVCIYDSLNRIYNWYVLQDILQGEKYISQAFINKYNKYSKDLDILKKAYKQVSLDSYRDMFRKEQKDNYASYNGKNQNTKLEICKIEDLYKRVKKDLNLDVKDSKPFIEEKLANYIMEEIKNESFLVKLNATANAAIPYQLHLQELEIILENQSKYYKTLLENKDNIIKLMKFRIPYYVGPLEQTNKIQEKNGNVQNRFAWVIRKSDDKILPWTFEDIVDVDLTAEKFIKRMTNKCTYLINEDVIPKQSILYSKFCVLNELANIRVNEHKLSVNTKKQIIDNLFKVKKTVRKSDLKEFLINNQIYREVNSITGLADEDKFISNMNAYIDMKKILGNVSENNINIIEKIIEYITIFEDKKILKRKIEKEYHLDKEVIKKLAKLNYTGWSRLSVKLLDGLRAKDDGKTIIEKLATTQDNFMQIINNDKYGFNKQIEDLMPSVDGKIEYDKDIACIPTSPANKRGIWQTIKIVEEITKVMHCEPNNIYIEFARNEEEKKKKDNRAKKLLELYEKFIDEMKDLKDYNPKIYQQLKNMQNDKDFNERLYLYFIQNGRCLYSSEPLEIDNLNLYEVDHIIPQCYVKDDSLSNKALVKKSENQRKSGSLLLEDKIINKQILWWSQLCKCGLMDNKKFHNLTRRKMFETDDEKIKFISRQLVETRQITKYVTNLLVNEYKNSNVFSIRAELTHNFRKEFDIYKNRNVNNYHHAQDAYIISIIGNVIDKKLKYKDEFKYKEYIKKYIKDIEKENEKNKSNKMWLILKMISNNIDISQIKRVLEYKDCFITRKLEEQTGEFYHQTLYSPNDKTKKIAIPVKNGKVIEKYGGYSNENKAYCSLYSYIDKKGNKQYGLIGIPIKISYDIKDNKCTLEQYIKLKIENVSQITILKNKVLKNQEYLDDNNELMRLVSDSEIVSHKELIISRKYQKIVYDMNNSKIKDVNKEKVDEDLNELYNYLLEKMKKEYLIFNSEYEKLNSEKKRKIFVDLEIDAKTSVLNGLIDMMEKGQGNLKQLNESDRVGRRSHRKFNTKKLINMIFIDKSITGMYERRYRVNGLENNCSK